MALTNRSLILYGFQVTPNNSSLDFRAAPGGPVLLATLNLGFYSLTALGTEICRAMKAVDPANDYTFTVNRTVMSGIQNRVTITTDGTYLDLLFSSGPRIGSSIAPYLGFNAADYTGFLSYTSSQTAGTALLPDYVGYNYISPEMSRKLFGAVNISANGEKESVTFQVQKFIQVEYKYEPEDKVKTEWVSFIDWAIQQRLFEITPDITYPSTFFEVTLEKSEADSKGLAWRFKELLPRYPFMYTTGPLTFRVRPPITEFI